MTATEVPIGADPDLAMMGEVLPNAAGRLARFHLSRHLLTIFVVVVALLWLMPSISMLVISFRPEALFEQSGWWHLFTNPAEFTISNYKNLFAGPKGGTVPSGFAAGRCARLAQDFPRDHGPGDDPRNPGLGPQLLIRSCSGGGGGAASSS